MNNPNSTRRQHLISSISAVALLSCSAWPVLAMAATPPTSAHANLLRLLAQLDAVSVGVAVLPQLINPTPAGLVGALEARLSGFFSGNLAAPCELEALQLALQHAVRADFADGLCVSVDGWVLAKSEVELCALAALSWGRTGQRVG